jgi:SAM-dependent methyltransferase
MVRMVDLRGRVLVDAGCGLGDLAAYLAEKRIGVGRYVGVDAFAGVVAGARERGLAGAEFVELDFAHRPAEFGGLIRDAGADVVVFSGSLNTFDQADALAIVGVAFAAARVGVVFNFLSAASPKVRKDPDDPARRFDPAAVLAWALGQTPRVRMRSDYLRGHDATVAMMHQRGPIRPPTRPS